MKKKKVSKNIQQAIVRLLKMNAGKPLPRKQISHFLNIKKKDYHIFENSLNDLVKDGRIIRTQGHTYVYQNISRQTGELRTTRAGFGFVEVAELGEDIFISRANLNTAFDRDIVEVQLYAQTRGKRQEGFITQIIKRFNREFVGTYRKTEYYSYVIPDSPKIYRDIIVAEDKTMNAKDGQKVVVRFDHWESDQHNPEGTIIEILGDIGTPGVDVISVAYAYNLPIRFPKEVIDEADIVSKKISKNDFKDRLDLRDIVCFTIDPPDAKDFDDAVSLEILENGNWRLGVHIADVSHYVRPGTKLEKEAYKRGTSVYLVDRVIPMLPERLSGDICSLKPETDRLTFSCFMDINSALEVVDYQIKPSVIHSKRRYNYEEVQDIYDRQAKDPNLDTINRMYELSKKLTQKRFDEGSIDFDTPEVRFILDDKGRPTKVLPYVRLNSHRLVEEFMLLANKTVAQHILNISPDKNKPLPFLYRVHEKPDTEKMLKFFNFLKAIGVRVKPVRNVTSSYFQEILSSIKGTPEEKIIEEVALRSMMKAVYSEKNIGHFGLSFKDYTHFTSPIRRYPDLIVHRMLKMYEKQEIQKPKALNKQMKDIGYHSTKMERLATEAERESIKLKQVEYIQNFIGETFHGIVSGVTSFGIFVALEDNFIEGFVEMTNMSDDYYIYDEETYSMTGRHTGRRIRLGDRVEIQVTGVSLEKREINFQLLEDPDHIAPVIEQPLKKAKRKKRKK